MGKFFSVVGARCMAGPANVNFVTDAHPTTYMPHSDIFPYDWMVDHIFESYVPSISSCNILQEHGALKLEEKACRSALDP